MHWSVGGQSKLCVASAACLMCSIERECWSIEMGCTLLEEKTHLGLY